MVINFILGMWNADLIKLLTDVEGKIGWVYLFFELLKIVFMDTSIFLSSYWQGLTHDF